MESAQDVMSLVKEKLDEGGLVKYALLFGSFARGKAKAESDVDIAVAADHAIPVDILVDLGLELSDLLTREVDLIDLMDSHGSSLQEPMMKGIPILLKDPSVRERLLSRMMREHEDDEIGRAHV